MASSDDGRNDGSRDPHQTSENPFIKFRQFADAQIGSFLQSIVGLPSTFSKQGNTIWADFDEDMKRRDELQARQQELRDWELERANKAGSAEEVALPVKKSSGRDLASTSSPGDSRTNKNDSEDDGERDLPLYSAVNNSLFSHLQQIGDEQFGWKPLGHGSFRLPGEVEFGQRSQSAMKTLQYMCYNELNRNHSFRSEYSLLPYLLFSSYSPIKLARPKAPDSTNDTTHQQNDSFPYCEAFEDLLLATHGSQLNSDRMSFFPRFSSLLGTGSSFAASNAGFLWISELWDLGLLQRRETVTYRATHEGLVKTKSSPSSQATEEYEEAQTEQDMYDRFFECTKSATGILEAVESLIAETGLTGKAKDPLPNEDEKEDLRVVAKTATKTSTVSAPESDKVISTRTTTSHTTHEDGSVETSMEIWKQFADGRESVTTRTHIEDSKGDESGTTTAANTSEASQSENKDGERKGWFWD